jgi:hypothetical protein
MFGFFVLFVSTSVTVCYSFRLFYFVLCGEFNFVPSYSMVETSSSRRISFRTAWSWTCRDYNPMKFFYYYIFQLCTASLGLLCDLG